MRAARLTRWLLGSLALLLPVGASALSVTYGLTSGTLTVTATLFPSTTILLNSSPSASVALTGTSFTFDAALVPLVGTGNAVLAFQFVTAPSGPFTLTPTLAGVTTISFGALTVTADVGFTSVVSGSNPTYTYSMGPILVTGSATTNLGGPNPLSVSTPSANGSITVGTNLIQVLGITIGAVPTAAGLLLLKGDFVFHGSTVSVPEPGTAALLMAGAIAIVGARLRRSS
jgi:hypothetical protein